MLYEELKQTVGFVDRYWKPISDNPTIESRVVAK